MAHIDILTKDDGFPSDFTHKRVSDALDRKGEILAYKHLLLGWIHPKTAYLVKLVAENAKDVIGWGYQLNFKIIDMLIPSGGALVGAVTGIGDIALFLALKDYADGIYRANPNTTTPEKEYAKLLAIFAMPYGMLILVGMAVFNLSSKDWGKILYDIKGPFAPGTELSEALLESPAYVPNLLEWFLGLFTGGTPPQYPDVEEH